MQADGSWRQPAILGTVAYKSLAIPTRCFSPPLRTISSEQRDPVQDSREDVLPLLPGLPTALSTGEVFQVNVAQDVEELAIGTTAGFHLRVGPGTAEHQQTLCEVLLVTD